MTDTTTKRVELQPEDRERMRYLSGEVRDRLAEMAQITARTLGMDLNPETVVKFDPLAVHHDDGEAGMHVEIICGPEGCGCYVEPPGICEFPCGAAGPL